MNLTDEQIEAAAKTMYCTQEMVVHVTPEHPGSWERLSVGNRTLWRKLASAAAPFLQMPWEMPTSLEEVECSARGTACPRGISETLWEFVRRRNASLIPKPVDPRREKVFRTLLCNVAGPHDLQVVTDRILAALDAKDGDGFGNHTWMETTVGNRKCTNCGLMSFEDPRACTGSRS